MKSRLSQNFLSDPAILGRIVKAAQIAPGDTVIEIGPGHGSLTRPLCDAAARVIAIEFDRHLYDNLKHELADRGNLELVHMDAMRYPFEGVGEFKVVANIPYHITTPIIFRLMEHKGRLKSMTLTVQKEVAERIAAPPGGRDYGVLSISVQLRAEAQLQFTIPKTYFRPVPRVDSATIHIRMRETPLVKLLSEERFFEIVRAAFSMRRKTIHNGLKALIPDIDAVLTSHGIDPRRRPETLSIEEFAAIANSVTVIV